MTTTCTANRPLAIDTNLDKRRRGLETAGTMPPAGLDQTGALVDVTT